MEFLTFEMDNPYQSILKNIVNYFVRTQKEEFKNYAKISTLIRIHSDKLAQLGDVSFPIKPEIWYKYFLSSKMQLMEEAFNIFNEKDETVGEQASKFLEEAKQWQFPAVTFLVKQERMQLYFNRRRVIEILVAEVLQNPNFGQLKKIENKRVYLNGLSECERDEDLSAYRCKLFYNVVQNLIKCSRWNQVDAKDNLKKNNFIELKVQSVMARDTCRQYAVVTMKCGLVVDPSNNGKVCQVSTKDYLSIRSNDMTLMALHKCGIRQQDARFHALMKRLGSAAVTVDLLEVKPTSPVQIIRNGIGSTKGGSFILYNSARIEAILRNFQNRVISGDYDAPPPPEAIQWDLLNAEEEWQLIYVYLAGFPNLIERCMQQLECGLCSTHLIIHFLHGLVSIFSVYYRRIKILTEKRDHLMPFVYARIYLIKAVRNILNKSLALIDIEPVEFM